MDAATLENKADIQAEEFRFPDFLPATLLGESREFILDLFRCRTAAWTKLEGYQQRDILAGLNERLIHIVDQTVRAISAADFPIIDVSLGKWGVNEGVIDLKVTAPAEDDTLLNINRRKVALLVLADPRDFYGSPRKATEPEPDQPDLPLDAEVDPETGEIRQPGPGTGGMPLEDFERRLEKANAEGAEKRSRADAEAEARGRKACDEGKERACPRSSGKYRDAWTRGYDARGIELAREAIATGASAGDVVRRMKEVGIAVPAGFPDAAPDAGPEMPDAPDAPADAA